MSEFAKQKNYTADDVSRVRWAVEGYLREQGIGVPKLWKRMDAFFQRSAFEKEITQQDIANLRNGTQTGALKLRLIIEFLEAQNSTYAAAFVDANFDRHCCDFLMRATQSESFDRARYEQAIANARQLSRVAFVPNVRPELVKGMRAMQIVAFNQISSTPYLKYYRFLPALDVLTQIYDPTIADPSVDESSTITMLGSGYMIPTLHQCGTFREGGFYWTGVAVGSGVDVWPENGMFELDLDGARLLDVSAGVSLTRRLDVAHMDIEIVGALLKPVLPHRSEIQGPGEKLAGKRQNWLGCYLPKIVDFVRQFR